MQYGVSDFCYFWRDHRKTLGALSLVAFALCRSTLRAQLKVWTITPRSAFPA
jgi:hypothetical protein